MTHPPSELPKRTIICLCDRSRPEALTISPHQGRSNVKQINNHGGKVGIIRTCQTRFIKTIAGFSTLAKFNKLFQTGEPIYTSPAQIIFARVLCHKILPFLSKSNVLLSSINTLRIHPPTLIVEHGLSRLLFEERSVAQSLSIRTLNKLFHQTPHAALNT